MTKDPQQAHDETPPRLRTLAQLVRLPNVFTAMADVMMGYLVTHSSLAPWRNFAPLLAASCALYLAGMVLNDYFDRRQDAVERPDRPIPSGRVAPEFARALGFGLLALGVVCGLTATALVGLWRCGVTAAVLACAVLAYDGVLKRTPLAPLAMGFCRMLNVLLGMSAAIVAWHAVHWLVAVGIGVYIAGVTWFARTEAQTSSRLVLVLALIIIVGGMAVLTFFPLAADELLDPVSMPDFALHNRGNWYLLMGVLTWLIGWRCLRAVVDPRPAMVQIAVKHCLLSLIMLDAAVCVAVRGQPWPLAILALIAPAFILGRWIYST